jgi:DNA-binding cell septation regulator SpoVG
VTLNNFVVDIQLTSTQGSRRAWAIVSIALPGGSLKLSGFSVVEQDGKPAWVGFPSKQTRSGGRYFPVVEAGGELQKRITEAVIEAYKKAKAA